MINGKKTTTATETSSVKYANNTEYKNTSTVTGNYIYPTAAITGQKDAIDIILIAVSTLIIISSFTYLFFV